EDTTAVEAWQLRALPHSSDAEACAAGGFRRKLSKLTLFREVFGNASSQTHLINNNNTHHQYHQQQYPTNVYNEQHSFATIETDSSSASY
ncbi:unnamed protein product, partial [Trichobilharzia regenti]